jgi:hypothetical protein
VFVPNLPHLRLISLTDNLSINRSRGFSRIIPRSSEEKEEFRKKVFDERDEILEEFKGLQEEYGGFVDPELIFRIKSKTKVDAKDIKRIGLKVLAIEGNDAVIVFASEGHLNKFTEKIDEYTGRSQEEKKHAFLDAFEDLKKITQSEKIGPYLSEFPINDGEKAIVDIEFWFLGSDQKSLEQMDTWAKQLDLLIESHGGQTLDRLRTKSFFVVRTFINFSIFNIIINLPQISYIDHPPKTHLDFKKIKNFSINDAQIHQPAEDAPGVLLIDSGIMPGHPLLSNSVGEIESFMEGKSPIDENGHGTSVAGVALYDCVEDCIDKREFIPECWLFSARVLDENAEYNDQLLIERQFLESINYFIENYKKIKIINISIGNDEYIMKTGRRQFRWASIIDEFVFDLSKKGREIIVVISSGNYFTDKCAIDYPNYLINSEDANLIEPATAALAITVGSLSPGLSSAINSSVRPIAGQLGFPSPFTRTGPGVGNMIKPELVDLGGDIMTSGRDIFNDPSVGVVSTNIDFLPGELRTGDLFVVDNGTSISAPKVCNKLIQLWKMFPDASANLIKALLISSAFIPGKYSFESPSRRQIPLSSFIPTSKCNRISGKPYRHPDIDDENIYFVYGYGLADVDRAKYSDYNRVLLIDESTIKLNSAKFYEIPLPNEFYSPSDDREISVTLCFDPETRRTRGDSYLGCKMKFYLYRNSNLRELQTKYKIIDEIDDENTTDDAKLIQLLPGQELRSNGCIQKGIATFQRPRFRDEAIHLVIICQNKWINESGFLQKYAVVVKILHKNPDINLYNPIRARIMPRIEHRVRIKE